MNLALKFLAMRRPEASEHPVGMEWENEHFPMFTVPLEIFLQMTKVQEYEDLMETLHA